MTRNKFLVCGILAYYSTVFDKTDTLESLGFDSFSVIEAFMDITELTGVDMDTLQVNDNTTVEDVIDFVQSR